MKEKMDGIDVPLDVLAQDFATMSTRHLKELANDRREWPRPRPTRNCRASERKRRRRQLILAKFQY